MGWRVRVGKRYGYISFVFGLYLLIAESSKTVPLNCVVIYPILHTALSF